MFGQSFCSGNIYTGRELPYIRFCMFPFVKKNSALIFSPKTSLDQRVKNGEKDEYILSAQTESPIGLTYFLGGALHVVCRQLTLFYLSAKNHSFK